MAMDSGSVMDPGSAKATDRVWGTAMEMGQGSATVRVTDWVGGTEKAFFCQAWKGFS